MFHIFLRKSIGALLGLLIAFAQASPAGATDGSLDPSFGNGGIVFTDFGGFDSGSDVEIQPDGKIIVVGGTSDGVDDDFGLARYYHDGSPDTTFGIDGKVTTDFAGGYDSASAVALQPDGKIMAAGIARNSTDFDFALARYNPDGSLDKTFDKDGKVISRISLSDDYAMDVALQPDGKILVSGWDSTGFVLTRYNSDGRLDTTFANEGVAEIDFGCSSSAHALALQLDGKILVAGDACGIFGRDFGVARYDSNGRLDTTFDGEGIVITDFDNSHDTADAVTVQSDGKIVLAGHSYTDPNVSIDFALARYNSDGSLDMTFNEDGKVTSDLGGWRDFGNALALQADGKLLVAGEQWQQEGGRSDFALARYNPDGALDEGFGSGGIVITDLGSDSDFGAAITVQPDGRILVAGLSNSDFALARYEAGMPVLQATLDVLPGKFPNRIELKKNVCRNSINLPVAILTTPEFNALQLVDATSLQMGDPVLGGTAAPNHSEGRDVDRDGDRDVLLIFALCDLISNNALNRNSTELVLTGSTLDGGSFTASDSVEVISHRPPIMALRSSP